MHNPIKRPQKKLVPLNILLVNPNRMKNPPVIPIGLEYLLGSLEKNNANAEILDLCFSEDPIKDLEAKLMEKSFDIVGFTIRNIDSSLYFNNEFYLPEIRNLVQIAKKHEKTVVIGGTALSANPEGIVKYLGADYGVLGPGELSLVEFLKTWTGKFLTWRIYDGWRLGPDVSSTHERGQKIDYAQYTKNGSVVGFETHTGCEKSCPYCIEACEPVKVRDSMPVIKEIEGLVKQGYNHFHTCDSEFNADLNYSIDFCKELAKMKLDMKWALYMKPHPYNEELFIALKASNAYLITLSVDSDAGIQSANGYTYGDLEKILGYCKSNNIELAIDALTGYPREPLESTVKMINFFKHHRPNTVGLTFYYRLSKSANISELIASEPDLQKGLTRPLKENEDYLEPIFYHQLERSAVEELISGDSLFNIAGVKPGVNYQIVNK